MICMLWKITCRLSISRKRTRRYNLNSVLKMGTISFSVCNRLSLSLSLSHTYTQTHAHTGTHTHMQHAYLFFYVTSLILTPLTLRGIPSQFGFVKFVLGLRQNIPLMMLVIVLVLKIAFCLHIEHPPPSPKPTRLLLNCFRIFTSTNAEPPPVTCQT